LHEFERLLDSAVGFDVGLLAPVAMHVGDGHPLDSAFDDSAANLIQFPNANERFDFLHD
jgi:hypothetical protein